VPKMVVERPENEVGGCLNEVGLVYLQDNQERKSILSLKSSDSDSLCVKAKGISPETITLLDVLVEVLMNRWSYS